MKKLFALLLALAMVISAVACGTAAPANTDSKAEDTKAEDTKADEDVPTEGASGDAVELTIWGWNATDIGIVFDEYKKATGANVTLNYVTVQQTEAFQKLQTTMASGLDMPDIVPSEVGQRGTMIALDIWENLLAEPYNFDTSNIFEYQINLLSNERGELVFVPMDISTAALAYKKALTKEYLGTDDPDELMAMLTDWDAFIEKGIEVKEKSNGEKFMFASLTGVKQVLDGQNPLPIIADNKLDMTSVNESLAVMQACKDAGIVDTMDETSAAYSASYADDIHIFYPCASWTPNYVIAPNDPEGDDRWGLIIPPGGCYSWGGSALGIPQGATHKTEAWDFLNWFTSLEGCKTVYTSVHWNDSNPAMYLEEEYVNLTDPHFGDQNLGEILFVKAMENLIVRPVSEHDATISDCWNVVIQAMIADIGTGSFSKEDAAQMFEDELRNKVDTLE